MKLLLGCGGKKIKGYTSVDIDPKVKPDIVDDMCALKNIENNSAEYIKVQHALEHLTYKSAITALKTWYRVLRYNGSLSIELPDLERCCELIQSSDDDQRIKGINGIYGDIGNKYLSHKYAWSFKSLYNALSAIGFTNIERSYDIERLNEATKYNRDMRVIAKRRKI